ncbi:Chitinase [hydrothermal vent metagenome]|uniref:Chitinase n=1 Tax=hydrothermal vent metagenome TaxID=652676 RepID=A0A1W1CWL7_9ZZZZ
MKTKLILLIAILTNWLWATTIYENGDDASDWRISDNRPSGATISSVSDNGGSVIEFDGSRKRNAYLLGDKRASSSAWNNSEDRNISWSMKFNESFEISIFVKSKNGDRVISYGDKKSRKRRGRRGKSKIYFDISSEFQMNQWQTFARDLEADLKSSESDNELEMVYGFMVRGSGRVDDIKMGKESTPQSPTNISLSFINEASSSFTTKQNNLLLKGYASSNIGVKSISCINKTTNQTLSVTGTAQWSVNALFVQGDNNIECEALANDNQTTSKTNVIVVYYPNSSFTALLDFSENTFFTDETKSITAHIGIDYNPTSNIVVKLYEVDANGNIKPNINYPMYDNGTLPDEIDKDEIFTVNFNLNKQSVSTVCYRVGVIENGANEYLSEQQCINIVEHITQQQMQEFMSIGDDVEQIYDNNNDAKVAAQIVYDTLLNDPRVGAVGINEDGEGVWYVSVDGIAGGYSPFKNNYLGAMRESTQDNKIYPRVDEPNFIKKSTTKPKNNNFKTKSLMQKNKYFKTKSLMQKNKYFKAKSLMQKSSLNQNEVSSKKAFGIFPFTNNPNGNSVGGLYAAWNIITNKNSCQLYATTRKANNGSVSITIDDFKDLSDYGYIQIGTHGDNYYKGLFSNWQPQWGPNGWLTGYLSQVVLFTGIKLNKDSSGNYIYGVYEKDIKSHNIIIGGGGLLAITPAFIKKYVKKLPNSIVVLEACRSGYNSSMADAFLSKNAKTVVGYTNYVYVTYAENTTKEFIKTLYTGKNTLEAFNSATSKYGTQDTAPYYSKFRLFGSQTLKLASSGLKNGNFEDATLTPWKKIGDGRIITGLGAATPTDGTYMGIISTGLGYTTDSGSIEQTLCLTNLDTTLSFDWNFFSEEFLEYCGSIYQDKLMVNMCEFNSTTNTTSNCTVLFKRKVDDLCGSVSAVSNNFDQGDVYATGWNTEELDISAYAGKSVSLKFYSTDVGDSIYDSAILLDKIEIK